jgi:hypothetical protein
VGRGGGDVDDVPGPALAHAREDGRDAVQHPAQIDVDGAVPVVDAQLLDEGERHHAGVVDQDVDMPVACERGVGESLDTVEVGDVQLRVLGVVAGVGELGDQLVEAVHAAGAEDDVVSGGGQVAGGGLTDAAGGAGHQDDLAVGGRDRILHSDLRKGWGRTRWWGDAGRRALPAGRDVTGAARGGVHATWATCHSAVVRSNGGGGADCLTKCRVFSCSSQATPVIRYVEIDEIHRTGRKAAHRHSGSTGNQAPHAWTPSADVLRPWWPKQRHLQSTIGAYVPEELSSARGLAHRG